MSLARVSAVVSKELIEMRRNRLLMWTIAIPPLALTFVPLGVIKLVQTLPARPITPDQVDQFLKLSPEFTSYTPDELMQVVLLRTFLTLFLLLPLVLPLTIAAHSIIGEKQLRSLEPLLATPIRTGELLLGKSVAAVAPAVAATWFAYAVFYTCAPWVVPGRVYRALLDPMWIVAAAVLAPMLSLLSVSCGVVISSRVNDAREAQNAGVLLVLPVIVMVAGQAIGWLLLDLRILLVGSAAVALLDAGVLYVGVWLFERETILTRWK